MIPLFKVFMSADVDKDLIDVLHSGYIGEGKAVKRFEKELAFLWGVPESRVIAVNSGTSALSLSLHLCNIEEGDEVISTPMTCLATNIYLFHRRAKIVWADVNPITGLIDTTDVARKMTYKTKAIIAVDYGGGSCDYSSLTKLNVPVIEDAAHALLTRHKGEYISSSGGTFVCYSFQAIKHLTCGDGGAIVVPEEYEKRARLLRWYGFDRDRGDSFRCGQDITEAGYKFHMNDISATIGLHNLFHVSEIVAKHRENARYYCSNITNPKVQVLPFEEDSSYWLFTVLVDDRQKFTGYLNTMGIDSSQVHHRNDTYSIFSDYNTNHLEGVDYFASRNVSIPVGWWLTSKEVSFITEVINNW